MQLSLDMYQDCSSRTEEVLNNDEFQVWTVSLIIAVGMSSMTYLSIPGNEAQE